MSSPASPRILRLGIVGLGRAATSMLPSLVKHPHVKLTAASDLRPEALEKFRAEFHAEVYADAAELFTSKNVDAVYIATPHQCHAEHVLMAAAHRKHAIVEKPMALTLAECDTMIRAVEESGIRLLVGHTHGFDPPVLEIRRIVRAGDLGPVKMIHTWNFTNFLYRPRRPEELDTRLGGGIIFNQVPHQVDIVRWIGGGLVRSVRAMTGVWDQKRATEGSHVSYLDFVDGTAATIVYSAYDGFDTDEFHSWVGEGGKTKSPDGHGRARTALQAAAGTQEEALMKAATGYGGTKQRREVFDDRGRGERYHPHFGVTVVSCERGDLRPSPRGVLVYSVEGKKEIAVPLGRTSTDKGRVIDEFYDAVIHDRPVLHDGRWGKATLEVCLAILESSKKRAEIFLSHQVPTPD